MQLIFGRKKVSIVGSVKSLSRCSFQFPHRVLLSLVDRTVVVILYMLFGRWCGFWVSCLGEQTCAITNEMAREKKHSTKTLWCNHNHPFGNGQFIYFGHYWVPLAIKLDFDLSTSTSSFHNLHIKTRISVCWKFIFMPIRYHQLYLR